MLLNEIKPSASLADYIRLYRLIDFKFDHTPMHFKAYPPRPEHTLQFFPKDTEMLYYPDSDSFIAGKKTALVGQHTTLNHRYVGKQFLVVQVVFQPGSLFRLTGIPQQQLCNQYLDAEDVFGQSIQLINEQLNHAKDYAEMIIIVENYMSSLLAKCRKESHPVDDISKMMVLQNNGYTLDKFIRNACICHRQFDRKFNERIGIAPRQYLQIIRFNKAYYLKNRYPQKGWLSLALECGYYDYQHLARDYKEFTGLTPKQFFALECNAPERFFGDIDT